MRLRFVHVSFLALALALCVTSRVTANTPPKPKPETHVEWVARSLKQMQTIRPGMTRTDLLKVFHVTGGLSPIPARTFVYRDCPYFKVDVTFTLAHGEQKDATDRRRITESPKDVIKTISRPYLGPDIED